MKKIGKNVLIYWVLAVFFVISSLSFLGAGEYGPFATGLVVAAILFIVGYKKFYKTKPSKAIPKPNTTQNLTANAVRQTTPSQKQPATSVRQVTPIVVPVGDEAKTETLTNGAKGVIMDFVAIDIETADSANSAPCLIGVVVVENGAITTKKEYLINPETTFNPVAIKIHKITPEKVANAPTLPQIWTEIAGYIERYPVVCHNASFDISVLKKACDRYSLALPKLSYHCTMRIAKELLDIEKASLTNVCAALNIQLDHHHNAVCDAEACARIMLHFMDNGAALNGRACEGTGLMEPENLDDFERESLSVIRNIINMAGAEHELIRYRKGKTLDVVIYYGQIKIGIARKKYFIAVKDEHLPLVTQELDHDTIKLYNRFYLSNPAELVNFSNYILTMIIDSVAAWNSYAECVSARTSKKHLNDYKKSTYGFLT